MSRALVSPTVGDSDKPTNSVFVPPPMQRLSNLKSPPGSTGVLSSKSQCPSDRASSTSSQSISSPLAGPNRAPSSASPLSQPSSSKPSNIFPRLHRLEIADDMGHSTKKSSLLDLNLSSHSFLDAVATDVGSDKPLYVVETVGSTTTIWRSDPWDGSAKIADIHWPKELPLKGKGRDHSQGVTIQINGVRWKGTSSLLKNSGLGSSRKFHIPHYMHALKWKKVGNTYTCTTLTCRGPVATLESFDSAPRLKVFETLGFHKSMPQLDHSGISLTLLDHLFVTALLLVTEPEDWMTVARNPASLDIIPDIPSSFTAGLKPPASNRQWRKIMYGEPLYPSLKTPSFERGASSAAEDTDVPDISEPPQLSTSMRQWRKIVYGEPLYPSLRPKSADDLDLPPRPSTATSFSSESGYYPPTPSSAPSTGYYDVSPLFDDVQRERSRSAPQVGKDNRRLPSPLIIPPKSPSPVPSSECMPHSAIPASPPPRRGLPAPPSAIQPPASTQPWLHRSGSLTRLTPGVDGSSSRVSNDSFPSLTASPVDQDDPSDQSMLTRLSTGWSVRQLPSIPTPRSPTFQISSGQGGPPEMNRLSQAHQRSLPPTPALMSRLQLSGEHLQSPLHSVFSPTIAASSSVRLATAHPGSIQNGADAQGRQRAEKDPHDVLNWMRSIGRAHRRRALDDENEAIYEPPPPAYNAIDFSTPPQVRSPEGT